MRFLARPSLPWVWWVSFPCKRWILLPVTVWWSLWFTCTRDLNWLITCSRSPKHCLTTFPTPRRQLQCAVVCYWTLFSDDIMGKYLQAIPCLQVEWCSCFSQKQGDKWTGKRGWTSPLKCLTSWEYSAVLASHVKSASSCIYVAACPVLVASWTRQTEVPLLLADCLLNLIIVKHESCFESFDSLLCCPLINSLFHQQLVHNEFI